MCIPTDRGHRSQAPRCLLRQIAQGHEAVLLDANLTESVSRLISDGPFAERIEGVLLVPVMVFKVHFLTSLRAGRQVVVSPFTPYWFSKCPFWPFFRKFLKNIFFAAHAALLSFCWDGHSFQNEGAGSGSPRRKSAGNDKKRPHRHKSLYGALRCGSVWKLSVAAGGHRYPTVSGYRPAMLPARLVAAALAAPPVLSCHTHRSLSSEKCWDSKNNGRPVQSSRRFPYTIRCFSVPQGWVSCYRRILISFRAFQDYPQGIR